MRSQAPLARIGASQTYGALPRGLEQDELERRYQDWARARGEITSGVGQGLALYRTQVPYGSKEYTSPEYYGESPFLKGVQTLGPLIAAPFTGGASLAAYGIPGFGGGGGMGAGGSVNTASMQNIINQATGGTNRLSRFSDPNYYRDMSVWNQ